MLQKKIFIPIFLILSFIYGSSIVKAESNYNYLAVQNFDNGSVSLNDTITSGNSTIDNNALYLQGTYLLYSFNYNPTEFDLEFDFKKIANDPYSRLIYFPGIDLEIEVKGSSNDLYIQGAYTGSWILNEYSHFRFLYSNNQLEIYLNGVLITTYSCSSGITGFQFGKGRDNYNYFYGYVDNISLKYNTYYFDDYFTVNDIPVLPVSFDLEHLADSSYFDELKLKNMDYCLVYDSKDNSLSDNKLQILCSTKILILPVKNSLQWFKISDSSDYSIMSFHIYDGKWYKGYEETFSNNDIEVFGLEVNGFIYASNFDIKRESGEVIYPVYSNKTLFPHKNNATIYDHVVSFNTSDVSNFYFNAVNPSSSGLFKFKIAFQSNNGIFPDYSFKYLTKQLDQTTYVEENDSISGFGFDYDGCVNNNNNNTQVCEGTIDLSYIKSAYPNTVYYQWLSNIYNYSDLDGTFTVFYTELSNFGFSTIKNSLKGLTKYIINGSDILVSPNGEFNLYIHSDYFRYLKLYDYDIDNQSYEKNLLANSLNDDFYYKIPINLIDSHYLRILTTLDSFVVFSDQSGLLFSKVDSSGNTDIAIEGSPNKEVNIGTPIVDSTSNNSNFLNDMKNAFSYFKNVFIFVFNLISDFYYSFPVGFRYFVIFAHLLTIIFVILKTI